MNKYWKTNKLKRNEFWCVFCCSAKFVRIGYKRYSDIEEEYKEKEGRKFRVVVLNDSEIRRGYSNGFIEYFKMFSNIVVRMIISDEKTQGNAGYPQMEIIVL